MCMSSSAANSMPHMADRKAAVGTRLNALRIPEEHVAKVWNMAYYSGLVCIAPYLNVYYKRLGISEQQIGFLAAVSPWVNASSGALWAAFADWTRWHKGLLILTSVLALMSRTSTAFVSTFPIICTVALLSETFSAPVSILSDIAIMSAAKTDGHYGEQRMFASMGWGIFSALSGYLVHKFSIYTAFQLFFALTTFALVPVCFLKFHLKPPLALGHQSAVAGTTNGTVSSTDHEQPPSDLTSFPPLSPIQTKSHSQPASDAQQSHDSLKPVTVAAANGSHAADTQLPAQPQRLSPRASLDLSLHPEDGTSCIVRIISDPPDAVYEDTDTVIEDPTLVAVLEHAVWRPDAHPVLHVPLPVSRRASHYGDTDSEADESMLSPARSTAGEHQLSQPLLNGHHSHQHHHDHLQHGSQMQRLWHNTRILLSNPEAVPFFAMSLLMGFGVGVLSTYLFLYLDELGGSEMLMGLCISVTCIVELPIFAANNWILKTLGVNSVIHLTLAVCAIRMAAYSTVHRWNSLWWVLCVESINGITFACFWPAGTLHCTRIAPPGMAATVQGVFTSLYGGVGGGLGGLFGGLVYGAYGAASVFQIGLGVILVGWVLCTICQVMAACICRRPNPEQSVTRQTV